MRETYEDLIIKLQKSVSIPEGTTIKYLYKNINNTLLDDQFAQYFRNIEGGIQIEINSQSPRPIFQTFGNTWARIFKDNCKEYIKFWSNAEKHTHFVLLLGLDEAKNQLCIPYYLERLCMMIPKSYCKNIITQRQGTEIKRMNENSWSATYDPDTNLVKFLWNVQENKYLNLLSAFHLLLHNNLKDPGLLELRSTLRGPELTIGLGDDLKLLLDSESGWPSLIELFHNHINEFINKNQQPSSSREIETQEETRKKNNRCSIQ